MNILIFGYVFFQLRWYPASDNIKTAKDVIITNRKTEGVIYGVEKRIVYKLRVLGYSNGGDGKMSPVTYFTLGILININVVKKKYYYSLTCHNSHLY